MKPFLKLIGLFIVLFSLFSCANGKKLQEDVASDIGEVSFSTWTGGTERSGSGYNLFVEVENPSVIQLDTVFFRGRKAVFESQEEAPNLFVARFRVPANQMKSPDVIMHEDPRREYGNPAPVIPEAIPFELEPNEAVLRVVKNGKVKYFKVEAKRIDDNSATQIKNPQNTSR